MNIPEGMTEDEALRASLEAHESGISDTSDDSTLENESNSEQEDTGNSYSEYSSDETEGYETDEEETLSDDENEDKPQEKSKKNKSNIAKLLAERNSLRQELEQIRKQQGYDNESIDFIEKTTEEKVNNLVEEKLFLKEHPDAVEIKDEIKSIAKQMNTSIDDAYTFYLAKTDPTKLLSEQDRNKMTSTKYNPLGKPKQTVSPSREFQYTEKELDDLIKRGIVKL